MMSLSPSALADENTAALSIQLAPTNPPPQGDRAGGRPPNEAFEACASKAVKDVCDVRRPDNSTLKGACQMPPQGRDDATFALLPGNRPKPEPSQNLHPKEFVPA